MDNKTFPNGFTSWQETHFEVVNYMSLQLERDSEGKTITHRVQESSGHGGLYEAAEELTDLFEMLHTGREWDGEFFEELESFLMQHLK